MVIAKIMIPCVSGAECRLDWTAVSAVGGWVAAAATFLAVLAALSVARKQLEAAKALQNREFAERDVEKAKLAVRQAHVFSKELMYARRHLAVTLANWEPAGFGSASKAIIDCFAAERPLPELTVIRSFSDRLDGFKDADAFAILSVLATWQFFNVSPGISAAEIIEMSPTDRVRMARKRVRFGLELYDAIGKLINELAGYYETHDSIIGVQFEPAPWAVKEILDRIRKDVAQ